MLWSPKSALISHLAMCVLPSCHIDLVFPKTPVRSCLWALFSLAEVFFYLIVTCFGFLTSSGLWSGSLVYWLMPVRILTDCYYLRKLICLDISLYHPGYFRFFHYSFLYMELFPSFLYPFLFTLTSVHKWSIPWCPKEKLIAAFLYSHDWLTCLQCFIREEKSSQSSLNIKSLIDEAQLSVQTNTDSFHPNHQTFFIMASNGEPWVKTTPLYLMGPQRQMALLFPNLSNFFCRIAAFLLGFIVTQLWTVCDFV